MSVLDGRSLRLGYYRKNASAANFDPAVDKVAEHERHADKICSLLDYTGRRIDFEYDCVVVAGGKFTALPARVFDMYDESRNGHSSSARIEVK